MSRVSSVYDFNPVSPGRLSAYRFAAMEVHEQPMEPSEPIRDIVCGTTKMVGGCLAFPILCPLNLVAGTAMTVYGCLCCRICDRSFENRRNKLCGLCGMEDAARVSSSLMTTGASEIRRTCCVEQEMVR